MGSKLDFGRKRRLQGTGADRHTLHPGSFLSERAAACRGHDCVVVCSVLFLATPLITLDGHDRVVDENPDASTDGTKDQPLVFDDAHRLLLRISISRRRVPGPLYVCLLALFLFYGVFSGSIYHIH
jgi:hypothetical protein